MTMLRIIAATLLLAAPASLAAQNRCITPARLAEIRAGFAAARKAAPDGELTKQVNEEASEFSEQRIKAGSAAADDAKTRAKLDQVAARESERVCGILAQKGWPTRAMVGEKGSESFLFLVAKALPLEKQLEIYPLVTDAVKAGDLVPNEVLGGFIDRLRLATGMKQLFGTQVYVKDGFLVLAPIARVAEIEKRRAEFSMTPLRSYERYLQFKFQLPLYRAVGEPIPPATPVGTETPTPAAAADRSLFEPDDTPILKIETSFVRLDIVVPDAAAANAESLEKTDFRVTDNRRPVSIETFAKADAPFDIVLLLDLSGSTEDKMGMIKKTTKQFVEMKRPGDRIAIVTFNDSETIVSPLEADKGALLNSLKKIGGIGSSHVWDAVLFAQEMLEKGGDSGRRKAIVLMSDGADNALSFARNIGSKISFADLIDAVRRSSVGIFPIYLDTRYGRIDSRGIDANARKTLALLADESAGNMYFAKRVSELARVYADVLKDVGTVYTIGFTPDVKPGDPRWREIKIDTPTHPGLKLKYRHGYFTN